MWTDGWRTKYWRMGEQKNGCISCCEAMEACLMPVLGVGELIGPRQGVRGRHFKHRIAEVHATRLEFAAQT